jgi:hypothetical protein
MTNSTIPLTINAFCLSSRLLKSLGSGCQPNVCPTVSSTMSLTNLSTLNAANPRQPQDASANTMLVISQQDTAITKESNNLRDNYAHEPTLNTETTRR